MRFSWNAVHLLLSNKVSLYFKHLQAKWMSKCPEQHQRHRMVCVCVFFFAPSIFQWTILTKRKISFHLITIQQNYKECQRNADSYKSTWRARTYFSVLVTLVPLMPYFLVSVLLLNVVHRCRFSFHHIYLRIYTKRSTMHRPPLYNMHEYFYYDVAWQCMTIFVAPKKKPPNAHDTNALWIRAAVRLPSICHLVTISTGASIFFVFAGMRNWLQKWKEKKTHIHTTPNSPNDN